MSPWHIILFVAVAVTVTVTKIALLQRSLLQLKVQLKGFVAVKVSALVFFSIKHVSFLSESPLNTDTPIIRTFWHVPMYKLSELTGFHCIFMFPLMVRPGLQHPALIEQ